MEVEFYYYSCFGASTITGYIVSETNTSFCIRPDARFRGIPELVTINKNNII